MKIHLWERCFNTFRGKKKLKLGGVRVLVAWLMLSGAEGKCRLPPAQISGLAFRHSSEMLHNRTEALSSLTQC